MLNTNDQKDGGPLAGFRVLELGSTVAGPFATRLLGDFGADVIKVESPVGDPVRSMGKQKDGRSLYAASILRNKRIACIDLKNPEGQELVRRLASSVDIVVENFRPGTLETWGLGFERLRADNPGLVMLRISGYGQDGPYSSRPGYGVVCEAITGLRDVTGDPDRPPARVGVSLTDYLTGLYGALGVVVAMIERERSGRGQIVDAALYEAAFSLMEAHVTAYDQLGHIAGRSGSRLPGNCPNSLYPTGDGSYIHIAAGADGSFRRLASAMDRQDLLEDPRFATAVSRVENEREVDAAIEDWTMSRGAAEALERLATQNVPSNRIYDVSDAFEDPHFAFRGIIARAEDPVLGPVAMPNVVPKLLDTPGRIRWAGHDPGQDTEAILREELGLSESQVDDLMARSVVR